MSGELKIVTAEGESYWFGRDDHFPNEVRVYSSDPHHWQYMMTSEARTIVREGLRSGGEVQQGDPVLFFQPETDKPIG